MSMSMKEGSKMSSSTEQPSGPSSSSASSSSSSSPQMQPELTPASPGALLHSSDPVARQREIEREIRIAEEFEREQHKQQEHDRQRFLLGQSIGASAEAAALAAAQAQGRRGSGSAGSGERKLAGTGGRTRVLHGHLLTTKIESALVRQASAEFASANAYLAASLWFDERSFKGLAKYMIHESKDELREGYALLQYIIQRRGHYRVRDVPAPVISEWTSAEKVIESLYQQEVRTANRINDLVSLCRTSGDVSTELFLHKFVRHQTDACDTMHTLLEKVSAFESSSSAQLFNMDKELLRYGEDSLRGHTGGRKKDADAGAAKPKCECKCKCK